MTDGPRVAVDLKVVSSLQGSKEQQEVRGFAAELDRSKPDNISTRTEL